MQHDPAYRDILTYPSPTTGDPVAPPSCTRERRRISSSAVGVQALGRPLLGMLGRTGDYLNSA